MSMKILLVEDNQVNCLLLSDYLEYCGYSVRAITCSQLFFSTLELFEPNLILLDIKMPKVDGYTILEEMQVQKRWNHIPIIVISALSFRSHQAKALRLGARRYLVKPIVPDVLRHVIQEELSYVALERPNNDSVEKSTLQASILSFGLTTNAQVC